MRLSLSQREARLAVIALAAVLVAVTWLLGEPRYEEWKQSSAEVDLLKRRQATAQRMLDRTDDLNERLRSLRDQLPSHPPEADVTSQLLRNLQQFADEHDLLLLRREPEPEREIGDLYELAITCTWEGELNALVRFLYALQSQGAIVDVRQLTITPVDGAPNRLRGTLTVDYAYSRTALGT